MGRLGYCDILVGLEGVEWAWGGQLIPTVFFIECTKGAVTHPSFPDGVPMIKAKRKQNMWTTFEEG